jgi:hypothetical protein
MFDATSSFSVSAEERVIGGETIWVGIRVRGAEWSWLTPAEAALVGRHWVRTYGNAQGDAATNNDDERELVAGASDLS